MTLRHFTITAIFIACACLGINAQERTSTLLNFGWKFHLGDIENAWKTDFDDSDWRSLDIPHDYQMELPWDQKSGGARGFKPMSDAWYRKTFRADEGWKGQKVLLDFEGMMAYGDIYFNGSKVGSIPYGYLGAEFDISKLINWEGDNTVAVKTSTGRLDASRWYTGGGLFRDVHIYTKNPVNITRHGLFITTPNISDSKADVSLQVEIEGAQAKRYKMSLTAKIYSPKGDVVAETSCEVPSYIKASLNTVNMPLAEVKNPQLWSCEEPNLYRAEVTLTKDGEIVDKTDDTFGIRTIEFTEEEGFKLNGKKVFLKGVANHHDLGALGAAAFEDGIERLVKTLKEFGYNHIRTSHNPYSPALLRMADKYGILIVDELFDKWQQGGANWVASIPFDQLWYKAETEWIRRDRNHPSVIMWSFGNELQIQEAWAGLPTNDWGITTYRLMKVLAQRYDPTRKTMVAMFPARANAIRNDPEWEGNFTPPELSLATDIAAYNYQYPAYKGYLEHAPHLIIYQSEATSNDLLGPFVGMNRDKMVGLAYWGAMEYWGESNGWPKKGWNFSYFSHNLDPYPQAYLIKSAFTDEPMCRIGVQEGKGEEMMWNDNLVGTTFISSHWNRAEGSKQEVWVYTNAEEAELIVNGQSLGTKKNDGEGNKTNRILWSGVEYGKGGKIVAIARKAGKEVARHELQTTGKAVALKIEAEDNNWRADGMGLKYVHVYAVDSKGNHVPTGQADVKFELSGEATIHAIDNGDHYTDELFNVNPKKLYKGQALAILRSTHTAGNVTLKVSSPTLKGTTAKFVTK